MNKRIIVVLSLLLFVPSVCAKDGVIRKYRYYKLDREYGDYAKEGTDEYPYIDKDDFIYSEYEISDSYIEPNENIEVDEVIYYEYKRTKEISYINILNQSSDLNIFKVEVRYDGELLNYECPELSGESFLLKANKDITLYLDGEYDQLRMTVRIVSDAENGFVHFTTGNSSSKQAVSKTYITNDFTYYGYKGTYFAYSKWVNDIYPNKFEVSRIANYVTDVVRYKYRYKLYHTYREVRNYYDEYLSEPYGEYIYRDDTDYIEIENKEEMSDESNNDTKNDEENNENNSEDSDDKVSDETKENDSFSNVIEIILKFNDNIFNNNYTEVVDVPNTLANNF